MAYNGSGTFLINTAGQPVVSGTVISSTAFNALTADLATGLSTAITKDGQTTVTANIPMSTYKFTGLGVGSAATDSANLSQVQSTVTKLLNSVSGADTITATASPTLAAYAAGQMFYFVAAGDNTTSVTLNIDALGAKAVTRDGSTALVAADIKSGEVIVVVYDGTRFQVVSQLNSAGNATFANVSITSALNVGGVATFTNNPVLSGGTANGVLYLNGSKVATSGSALTFDGTYFTANGLRLAGTDVTNTIYQATGALGISTGSASGITFYTNLANRYQIDATGVAVWSVGGSESMRLTSTGLGIGTASPAVKLDVVGSATSAPIQTSVSNTSTTGQYPSASYLIKTYNGSSVATVGSVGGTSSTFGYQQIAANQMQMHSFRSGGMRFAAASSGPITWATGSNTDPDFIEEKMRLDSSGNLGIGTSSPNRKLEVNGISRFTDGTSNVEITNGGGVGYIGPQTNHPLAFQTNNTERARLTAAGEFLVGTTTSAYTNAGRGVIEVNGSDQALYGFRTGGTARGYLLHEATNLIIDNSVSTGAITFQTNASEKARITSGGDLLVGTTSALGFGNNEFRADNSSGGSAALVAYNSNAADSATAFNAIKNSATTTSSQRFIQFYANAGSTAMGGIVGNGASNVQFATISDVREKTNIQPITGSLEKIVALKPVSFDWIKSGEQVKAGFVAQDVEQVFPEFVVENMANEGEENRKGLTGGMTGGIIAHLVKAMQEQQAIITALTARLTALESK